MKEPRLDLVVDAEPSIFGISELAKAFGITSRALRFYEDRALLNPRRIGKTRLYSTRDRARLQLILRGKRLGFSLAEIKAWLDLYELENGPRRQYEVLLTESRKRIADLERQLDDLTQTLRELKDIEQIALRHLEKDSTASLRSTDQKPLRRTCIPWQESPQQSVKKDRPMKNVVIAGYARSPFHFAHKGDLVKVRPDDLAAQVVRGLIERTGVKPEDIEDVIVGCAFPEGEQGFNVARLIGFLADLPLSVAGVTVNRFCGSSMQSVHMAAGAIQIDAGEVFICAGIESMTRVPHGRLQPDAQSDSHGKVPASLYEHGHDRRKRRPSIPDHPR